MYFPSLIHDFIHIFHTIISHHCGKCGFQHSHDSSKRLCYNTKTETLLKIKYADMAELADAHGSGPCESNFMEVQVLLSAPKNKCPLNL